MHPISPKINGQEAVCILPAENAIIPVSVIMPSIKLDGEKNILKIKSINSVGGKSIPVTTQEDKRYYEEYHKISYLITWEIQLGLPSEGKKRVGSGKS